MPDAFDLDELSRLHEAATPEPWRYYNDGVVGFPVDAEGNGLGKGLLPAAGSKEDYDQVVRDAALIVAMRNALPTLIERVKTAEEQARQRFGDAYEAMKRAKAAEADGAAATVERDQLRIDLTDATTRAEAAEGALRASDGTCRKLIVECRDLRQRALDAEQAEREMSMENGRLLASQREHLAAAGINPAELLIPLATPPNGTGYTSGYVQSLRAARATAEAENARLTAELAEAKADARDWKQIAEGNGKVAEAADLRTRVAIGLQKDAEAEVKRLTEDVEALVADPIYAQVVVEETQATSRTTHTDPTPLVFAADLVALLAKDGQPPNTPGHHCDQCRKAERG